MPGTTIAAEILAPKTPAPQEAEKPVEKPVEQQAADPKKPPFKVVTREDRLKAAMEAVKKPEAPVEEKKPAPAPVATEDEKRKAEEFGAAARREKEFRERTEKTKADLAAREAKLKEQEQTLADLRTALQRAKEDPEALLKMAGITYDDLTQRQLAGGKLTPEDALKAADRKIEEFKAQQQKQIQDAIKKEQEQLETQKQKVREQFHNACLDFPTKAPEQFEYLKKFPGSGEYIHEVIIQDLISNRETNPSYAPMSLEKAAELVEAWLEKQVEGMATTKKFTSKFKKPEPKEEKPEPSDPNKVVVTTHERAKPKTITSSMTASTVSMDTHKKPSSKHERLERAKKAALEATKK